MGHKVVPADSYHLPSIEHNVHKRLPWKIRLAYSVGHVLNDLAASMWFSYFLLFYQSVLRYEARLTGILLLIGQVADAIATPVAGIESDKKRECCVKYYGQRKSWHLAGSILVAISLPFIFTRCPGCADSDKWVLFAYYAFFIIICHFGFASAQVAHVALITDLTPVSKERVELNAYRHANTVASNICVFAVTWLILGVSSESSTSNQLGPQDAGVFRNIILSITGIGCLFCVIFHVFVPEKQKSTEVKVKMAEMIHVNGTDGTYRYKSGEDNKIALPAPICRNGSVCDGEKAHQDVEAGVTLSNGRVANGDLHKTVAKDVNFEKDDDAVEPSLRWKDWFKKPQFYQVGLIYTACRLFFNVSQVYTPLYLQNTLMLPKESIAYIPLVIYISGFVFSFVIKPLNALTGTKVILIIGCIVGLVACVWIQFGWGESYRQWQIYLVAILLGFTTTTLVVASLALTADLIGNNGRSSAFVFSAMGFWDKMANGTAVIIIQEFTPSKVGSNLNNPYFYYREVLVYVCGGALVFTSLLFFTLLRSKIGSRKQDEKKDTKDPEMVHY